MPGKNTKENSNGPLGMSPVEVKIALMKLGISQVQIAKDLSVGRTTISQVISGARRSRRVEDHIRNLLADLPEAQE